MALTNLCHLPSFNPRAQLAHSAIFSLQRRDGNYVDWLETFSRRPSWILFESGEVSWLEYAASKGKTVDTDTDVLDFSKYDATVTSYSHGYLLLPPQTRLGIYTQTMLRHPIPTAPPPLQPSADAPESVFTDPSPQLIPPPDHVPPLSFASMIRFPPIPFTFSTSSPSKSNFCTSSPPPMLFPLISTFGTVRLPVLRSSAACRPGPRRCSSSSTT